MLSIEQLHAHTCAELVGMCRELGLPHSGRRKQVLVQALYDYQRSNGGIPPHLVSRFSGRSSHARFSQTQHAVRAQAAHHGHANASTHGYIPPYSSSQNYNASSMNFPPATHSHTSAAYTPPGQPRHQPLLSSDPVASLMRSQRPFANASPATASEGLHARTGDRVPFPGSGKGSAQKHADFVTDVGNGPFAHCLCRGNAGTSCRKGLNATLTCTTCHTLSHAGCYPADYSTQNFVCSLCRMKRLDPFFPVAEVLWDCRLELSHYSVELNTQNLRKWRADGKEVIVRCMQVDLQPLYQSWPKTMNIIINGRVEETVAAPSWEHKRRDMPIPITHYLKNSRNRVEFSWTNYDEPQMFHLGVFLCDSKSPETLANQVWQSGQVKEAEAEKRVLAIINNRTGNAAKSDDSDDDDVMCLEVTRRIKLLCPVTFMRIEVPCRGRACMHLQCYDLSGYLLVTRNTKAFNTRWKCPECHLYVRPDELVIDGFVQKILSGTEEEASVVELQPDASYRVVTEDELKEESKRAEKQRQLASGGQAGASSPEGDVKASQDGPAKKAFEVVEMLSDSDEDEEEAPGNQGDASATSANTPSSSSPTAVAPDGGPSPGTQLAETSGVPPASGEARGSSPFSEGSQQTHTEEQSECEATENSSLTPKIQERSRVDDDDNLPHPPKRSRRVVTSPVSSPAPFQPDPGVSASELSLSSPKARSATAAVSVSGASPQGSSQAVAAQNPERQAASLAVSLQRHAHAELVVLSSDEDGDSPGGSKASRAPDADAAQNGNPEKEKSAECESSESAVEPGREEDAEASATRRSGAPKDARGQNDVERPQTLCFKQKQEFPDPVPGLSSLSSPVVSGHGAATSLPLTPATQSAGRGQASPAFPLLLGQSAACRDTAAPGSGAFPPLPASVGTPEVSVAGAAADNPISVSDSSEEEECGEERTVHRQESSEGGDGQNEYSCNSTRPDTSAVPSSDSRTAPSPFSGRKPDASSRPSYFCPKTQSHNLVSSPFSSAPAAASRESARTDGLESSEGERRDSEGERGSRETRHGGNLVRSRASLPSAGAVFPGYEAAGRPASEESPSDGEKGTFVSARRGKEGERAGHTDGRGPGIASGRPAAGVRRARAPVVPPPLFLSRSSGKGDEGRRQRRRSVSELWPGEESERLTGPALERGETGGGAGGSSSHPCSEAQAVSSNAAGYSQNRVCSAEAEGAMGTSLSLQEDEERTLSRHTFPVPPGASVGPRLLGSFQLGEASEAHSVPPGSSFPFPSPPLPSPSESHDDGRSGASAAPDLPACTAPAEFCLRTELEELGQEAVAGTLSSQAPLYPESEWGPLSTSNTSASSTHPHLTSPSCGLLTRASPASHRLPKPLEDQRTAGAPSLLPAGTVPILQPPTSGDPSLSPAGTVSFLQPIAPGAPSLSPAGTVSFLQPLAPGAPSFSPAGSVSCLSTGERLGHEKAGDGGGMAGEAFPEGAFQRQSQETFQEIAAKAQTGCHRETSGEARFENPGMESDGRTQPCLSLQSPLSEDAVQHSSSSQLVSSLPVPSSTHHSSGFLFSGGEGYAPEIHTASAPCVAGGLFGGAFFAPASFSSADEQGAGLLSGQTRLSVSISENQGEHKPPVSAFCGGAVPQGVFWPEWPSGVNVGNLPAERSLTALIGPASGPPSAQAVLPPSASSADCLLPCAASSAAQPGRFQSWEGNLQGADGTLTRPAGPVGWAEEGETRGVSGEGVCVSSQGHPVPVRSFPGGPEGSGSLEVPGGSSSGDPGRALEQERRGN
ncbi:MIZ/SP-RING zinc finger domain-containing protein [Toxoplasma gondii]|uniref:MIZ/SP-RING zinc finger domain-containing protein n=4 Tax=Toxoplasma gondii TaxID=5811 RepID=A0A7J6JVZ2_TOXGO|nr:MIZ/SP-RING zinc finger domain-containing protein [Toxoplasma gondii]